MSKKDAILKAATELFARKGYKGTAASEIAERADVAQGTVFHHYKSKENLLIAICDELVRNYMNGIRKAAEGPGTGWDALERILKFNHEFQRERYDAIAVVFRETGDLTKVEKGIHEHFCGLVNQVIEVKKKCIKRGVEDGSIRPVPLESTALLVHFLLVGKFHVETEGLINIPDIDDEILEFCRRSLATSGDIETGYKTECGGIRNALD